MHWVFAVTHGLSVVAACGLLLGARVLEHTSLVVQLIGLVGPSHVGS